METEKQADNAATEEKATDAAPKSRGKKAAPKKRPVRAIKRATSRKASSAAAPVYEPSDEEIRLRAYFIAERRMQLSLQGDSTHDWIEARKQLLEEAIRTAS